METRVEIPREVTEALLAHARAQAPNECCGLLIGNDRRIARARPARNLLESPTRYRVDPCDHFAALREARAAGLRVIGAYHSHPASPPEPSPTDLAEALYPEYLYVIVGLATATTVDAVRGYRLRDGRAEALTLVDVD